MMPKFLLAALLISPLVLAKDPKPRMNPTILGPGIYTKDELPENPNGAWLGLVMDSLGLWKLKKVAAKVQRTHIAGDEPGNPTGYKVTAVGNERVTLFMRGLPMKARKKPIKVATDYHSLAKTPGEQYIVGSLGSLTFRVWGEPTSGTDKATVKLSWNNRIQELCTLADNEHSAWDILWAGDLDGDGAPDFIFAIAEGDLGSKQLLLSGCAVQNQLVGLISGHSYAFMPLLD